MGIVISLLGFFAIVSLVFFVLGSFAEDEQTKESLMDGARYGAGVVIKTILVMIMIGIGILVIIAMLLSAAS